MRIRTRDGLGGVSAQKKAWRRQVSQPGLSMGGVLLSAILLGGCSQLPDAVNPVQWYRGASDWVSGDPDTPASREADARDTSGGFPDVKEVPERPRVTDPAKRDDIVEGLIGDRENAKYTQERLNRQGAPTRPLAPRQPAAAVTPPAPQAAVERESAVAAMPAVQPMAAAPAAQAATPPAAEPALRPDPTPGAAPVVAAAPAPAAEPAAKPAEAVAAAETPAARQAKPASSGNLLEDVYRRRLAESAAMNVAPQPAVIAASLTGGGAPLPGSSRKVGAFGFAGRSVRLSPDGVAQLQEVARLHKEHGGIVRVVGSGAGAASSPDAVKRMIEELDVAIRRADAVARELVRLGVPAAAVTSATADTPPDGGSTEIYIDY